MIENWLVPAVFVLGLVFVRRWRSTPPSTGAAPEQRKTVAQSLMEQLHEDFYESSHGKLNPLLECPHCHSTGHVRTKRITKKLGISGAKATGALLTGGASLLATGLSRKDRITQAHCDTCSSTWHF